MAEGGWRSRWDQQGSIVMCRGSTPYHRAEWCVSSEMSSMEHGAWRTMGEGEGESEYECVGWLVPCNVLVVRTVAAALGPRGAYPSAMCAGGMLEGPGSWPVFRRTSGGTSPRGVES